MVCRHPSVLKLLMGQVDVHFPERAEVLYSGETIEVRYVCEDVSYWSV